MNSSKALDPVLTEPDTGIQLPTTIQYTSQVMLPQVQPRTQGPLPNNIQLFELVKALYNFPANIRAKHISGAAYIFVQQL
jgi:hypothetical protein